MPELAVANPLDVDVLLYDGEELLGAKQNRILNVTVLVAARSETRIPVSCVEEGRWPRAARFASAAGTRPRPTSGRARSERLSAAPLERGVAQATVWQAVAEKAGRSASTRRPARRRTSTPRGSAISASCGGLPAQPGQCGALLALGERFCLDDVSRPDGVRAAVPEALDGYLLDALERLDSPAADDLDAVPRRSGGGPRRRPSAGLGDDVRLRGRRPVGSGLVLDGEVLGFARSRARTALERKSPGRVVAPDRLHMTSPT